jgi:hypothetical protein
MVMAMMKPINYGSHDLALRQEAGHVPAGQEVRKFRGGIGSMFARAPEMKDQKVPCGRGKASGNVVRGPGNG